ncbi:hypothetical protein [Calothrix sp. 336/3]|uniref:hypothetical protein n=1 Tax=Calothrix sp. 336/3 TaxID=1337936 RepID=UPI0004E3E831|nr:hypothetical protein [Calothrix sp. 336/3]AKG20698.1 hypothetical protein IJ00_04705 [Calothrix sp. 336/3]
MLASKITNRLPRGFFHSPWLIIIVFSCLGFIGILNHAMWRDELNPWLIVRDSTSFTELVANIRYEGHPVLWYFSLAFLRQLADTPLVMQMFHLAIAIIAVTLFCLYSPFSQKQKILFTFGYFPFYEYLVISRNYAFSLLFIFAFCAAFPSRKKTYFYLATFLGLLANSSVYALFVSFSLFLTLLAEFCFNSQQRQQYLQQSNKYDLFLSLGIIIFSFLLSVYIITPPSDSYLHGGLDNGWVVQLDFRNLLKTTGRLFGSYLLIIPTRKRWLDLIVCGVVALLIAFLTLVKLSKKPFPFFFYSAGTSIILMFTYLRFSGMPRHFGHLYLVFIAALWLAKYYPDSNFLIQKVPFFNKFNQTAHKWHNIVFMVILSVQFCGGIYAFSRDLIIPFSAARETANYLQKSQLANEFIVASRDANMAALSGYLNRKLYYPELQKMGSYTLFKGSRQPVEQAEVLRQITVLLKNQPEKKKMLLILHKELKNSRNDLNIVPVKNFTRAWVDSERYYLYWVD